MPLIGIVGKKKDIQSVKKEINIENIDIIEITEESIKNLKNIRFDEIIFMEDIKINNETYKYMNEMISKIKYLIINADIEINMLKEIKETVKVITFGFNPKATITVSSVNEEKIIICIQRSILRDDKVVIDAQEKEIELNKENSKKIYNNLVVFIIKELHNY